MEKLITFIVENHQLIILVLACVLDIILFLFGVLRKKKMPLEDVFNMIPKAITKAEQLVGVGNGEKKKAIVMDVCVKWYRELTGVELVPGCRYYRIISEFVEMVLETPQKKGN